MTDFLCLVVEQVHRGIDRPRVFRYRVGDSAELPGHTETPAELFRQFAQEYRGPRDRSGHNVLDS